MLQHIVPGSKTRILMLLCFPLFLSCSAENNSAELSPAEETRVSIEVVGGKEGINVVLSPDRRTVRYLGEIENKGFRPFCPIDITFITKGSNGVPVGPAARVEIYGHTLSFHVPRGNGPELASCLKPTQRGSFDTGVISLAEPYEDFDFKICLNGNEEACRRLCLNTATTKCPPPDQRPADIIEAEDAKVPLRLILIEDQNDPADTFLVRVQNAADDSSTIPYDIRLLYTARNIQGRVIGSALSNFLPSQEFCSNFDIQALNPSGLGCLTAGVLTDEFRFDTDIIASDICGECSYFMVYHSECTLVGDNPPIGDGSCPDS